MNEEEKMPAGKNDRTGDQTDEIGGALETGSEANAAVAQQGDDAAAGIVRDTDAAKHEKQQDQVPD